MFPLTTFISLYLLLRFLSMEGFYNLLSADWHRSDWGRNAFLKLTWSCCSGGRIQAQVLGFLTPNQFFPAVEQHQFYLTLHAGWQVGKINKWCIFQRKSDSWVGHSSERDRRGNQADKMITHKSTSAQFISEPVCPNLVLQQSWQSWGIVKKAGWKQAKIPSCKPTDFYQPLTCLTEILTMFINMAVNTE